MRDGSLSWALLRRIVFLGAVAWAVSILVWVVRFGVSHGEACVTDRGVTVVRVDPRVVAYARAQGWPRVMTVQPRLGGPLLYDHSREADRVRAGVHRLCAGQRFRLAAREG